MGLLNIGATALNAAQISLATTGHNIANAATPGYSRQIVETGAATAQQTGSGFIGKGTQVTSIHRAYDQFLTEQVQTAQSSDSQLSAFKAKIDQVDNVLANPASGVTPILQDFFSGIQNVTNEANGAAQRQVALSNGESLVNRFQSLSTQIQEVRQSVNSGIRSSVDDINVQVNKIASLNKAISAIDTVASKPPNDLLDQRDQAVNELSKQIKVSVVKEGSNYNVFMGTGQTLVTGGNASSLYAAPSPTDSEKIVVGYKSISGNTSPISEKVLNGGVLGGLVEFRANTLSNAENALGRVAIALGTTFNAQHALGVTPNGDAGGAFFNVPGPEVKVNSNNTGTGTVTANITDVSKLTTSDYQLQVKTGATPGFRVTRISDGKITDFPTPANGTVSLDGVDINVAGAPANGDQFLIQPTVNGARKISMAIQNIGDIAAGAAAATKADASNAGTGVVTAPVVTSAALLKSPVVLTYSPGSGTLSGFPKDLPVTITNASGSTTYPANTAVPYKSGETMSFDGVTANIADVAAPPSPKFAVQAQPALLTYSSSTNSFSGFPVPLTVTVTTDKSATVYAPGVPVPYTPGATMSFGGISFGISGAPSDGDKFNVEKSSGTGDNRNAVLLGKLQTANILDDKSTSFQGGYARMVSSVGSKAAEVKATSLAAANVLSAAKNNQQEISGVNLDEEAANLIRYQQMYQAAGKVMQTANSMFQTLLSLGGP